MGEQKIMIKTDKNELNIIGRGKNRVSKLEKKMINLKKKEKSLQNQTAIKTAVELSGLSFAHTLSVGRLTRVAVETEPENREPAA